MENQVASPGAEAPKIKGFLRKLTDTRILIAAVLLKQILDVVAKASKLLERQDLLIFDVACIIELCMNEIDCLELSLMSEKFVLEGEQQRYNALKLITHHHLFRINSQEKT